MGTKEDIPDISIDQFEDMMSGDPENIVQTRVPDENPFEKVYFSTLRPVSVVYKKTQKTLIFGKLISEPGSQEWAAGWVAKHQSKLFSPLIALFSPQKPMISPGIISN